MNILHMKYAVEVARRGSLSRAAEKLLVAQPNISRSIKELEADLGITIFRRSAKGMTLTPDGEIFVSYAEGILRQLDHMERMYRDGAPAKQRFSISVPRACYISEAFSKFSATLGDASAEIFYKETNSQRTITNLLDADYKLGIIRYSESYDQYFKEMLEEKGLAYELVTEFSYLLLMSSRHPLAGREMLTFEDLPPYIEIAHADPYVPSLPLSKVVKEELPDNIERRIFIFERASQFDLLSENPETFMWVSPVPDRLLELYGLVQKPCVDNRRVYKDVLIYRKGYKLTPIDCRFIEALSEAKRRYIKENILSEGLA